MHGYINEHEANKVAVGQKVTVSFPFDDRQVDAKVEHIDTQVDDQTHTIKIRTTIPNPDGRLKADMIVRMAVESKAGRERVVAQRRPAEPDLSTTPKDRLVELERKVDQLLGEKEERLSHAKILERLDALERKLDQLLGGRR